MAETARPRIFVAVEPAMLGDALICVLEAAGVDDVAGPDEAADAVEPVYDLAVVTTGQGGAVRAEVRLELPNATGASGIGRVSWNGHVRAVAIRDLFSILSVLDTYCPGPDDRRARLKH